MDEMDKIYELYSDNVYKYLICLTSNIDLAEELTQETFYQAIKSINRYNGSCKMSVWLCQIAKHSFYNYLKKNKKSNAMCLNETDLSDLPFADNAEELLIQNETEVDLYRYIHQLSEPYREIFLLRTSTDLSFKDIGSIFNKSENWARVTYYRAKINLAERIEKNEY